MTVFNDLPAEQGGARVGIDLLLTTQVAKKERVNPKTVERWITKGLPAQKATQQQLGELVARGLLGSIPPRGVYLIRVEHLGLIPQIRAYPSGTTRSRRGKPMGVGEGRGH